MVLNFRAKMIGAIVALIVVPVIILGVLSYQKTEAILREKAQEQCFRTMENVRTFFIESLVTEVDESIDLLAGNPRLKERGGSAGLGTTPPDWDEYRRFHPEFTAIYFKSAEGTSFLSSTQKLIRPINPNSRPWYKRAIENPGRTVWSEAYRDMLTNRMIVTASRALAEGDKVYGVFGIDASLDILGDVIEKISFDHGGYAILIDQNGKVLANKIGVQQQSDISGEPWYREIKDRDQAVVAAAIDGKSVFVSSLSIPQTGWKLVGFIPKEGIERELAPIKTQTISVGIIAAILAIIIGIMVMSGVAAKLRGLVAAMSRVEQGDFSARWWDESVGEFGELSRKFNTMVTTLENLIQQHQASQNQIALQKVYFEQLFENSPESVAIVDQDDRVVTVNSHFCKMFGYALNEVQGRFINDLVVSAELHDEGVEVSQAVLRNKVVEKETLRRRKDGKLIEVFLLGYPIVVMGKHIGGYVIYRDITERKEVERKLLYASTHDLLTGVFNRGHFEEEMLRLEQGYYPSAGIIICDIDGLKLVNDTLGHAIGDEMLMLAARLLADNLPDGAVLCRIGGDEFAVLLPDTDEMVLRDFISSVKTSVEYANRANLDFSLSISIGYALRAEGHNMDSIYREADSCMYREKLEAGSHVRSALVKTLTDALHNREFVAESRPGRLQELMEKLARAAGITEERINNLHLLAQFHDIGKVVIPDDILFKPGFLSEAEQKVVRRHSETGYRIAVASPEFHHIAEWILKHHEWWDGGGYPLGLKGEAIPIECRILLIADAFDAMTQDRPYRGAMSPEAAIEKILACQGRMFDPELVDIFVGLFRKGEID